MKVSLQIRDSGDDEQQQRKPLLRAKVPVSVLGLPFTSGVVSGDPSDLSFSLQTNFLSGPSLKLAYTPSPLPTAAPFALSLKSGAGLFGSPNDSPFTISVRCSLVPTSLNPSFSLHFKPRFGHFSLNKAAFSPNLYPNPNPNSSNNSPSPGLPNPSNFEVTENAEDEIGPFEMLDSNLNPTSKLAPGSGSALAWKDLKKMESSCCGRVGILSGFAVRARTVLPLVRGMDANFRWGLHFPAQFGKTRKMPFLTVDKISFEMRRAAEDGKDKKKNNSKNKEGDMELLKGMCLWMSRDLEDLQKENREMKQCLQELRSSVLPARSYSSREIGAAAAAAKSLKPSLADNSSEFEQWRDRKKNGGGQEIRESSNKSCHP